MRQWTGSSLVQIMACRLFGAKPLSESNAFLLSIGLLGTSFSEIFIQENAFKNVVCQYCGHFSRGRWVNILHSVGLIHSYLGGASLRGKGTISHSVYVHTIQIMPKYNSLYMGYIMHSDVDNIIISQCFTCNKRFLQRRNRWYKQTYDIFDDFCE